MSCSEACVYTYMLHGSLVIFNLAYTECEVELGKTLQCCLVRWVGDCLCFVRSKGLTASVLKAIVLRDRLIICPFI